MKRIKAFLFSVLFVCCVSTVRASTNTVDYTAQLTQIQQTLLGFVSLFNRLQGSLDSIDDCVWDIIAEGVDDSATQLTAISNILALIKPRCDDIKTLLESSVSDLDSILYYVTDSSLSLQDLKTICDGTETSVISIDNSVQQVVDALPNLSDMSAQLQLIQGQIQSILDNGELNKEATQMQIVNILTGITDTADSIKDALDIIQQEGGISDITDAIAALKHEVTNIYRILNTWDKYFFSYLYDRTFPIRSYEFHHISGSPFFENGYITYSQQIGSTSAFSFVDWLAQALLSHTDGLNVINDNILFIAKVLGTNAQDQAMSEFQEDADETVSTISSQYNELIGSSVYTPKQFDFSKTKLQNVRQLFTGLSGVNGYDAVKVHNLNFASFETFGFPTHIEYKYDITETSSFWEVCRAVFTCLWIFLFAAVFFMVVRVFYKFYHICFNALAGNRSEGYEVSSIPLHW